MKAQFLIFYKPPWKAEATLETDEVQTVIAFCWGRDTRYLTIYSRFNGLKPNLSESEKRLIKVLIESNKS